MTGGGAADLAWLHEPVGNYAGDPTDTDYKVTGKDQQLEDLSIDNALQRLRNFSPEAKETIATTFEGAISVTGVVTQDTAWLLNHVFGTEPAQSGNGPYTYTWDITAGRVQSARFYAGLDYLDGFAERVLHGTVFPQIDFECAIGEGVQYTATGFFGDETRNTDATPGTAPSTTSDVFVFHGGDLAVDGSSLKKMQSATLSIQTGARPQRGWSRTPVDAVIGAVNHTLTPTKIVESVDLLDLTLGDSTGPSDDVAPADGSLEFSNGTETLTFPLTRATPNTHSWDSIGNPDEDVTESPELYVDEVDAELETDTAEAL